MTRKIQEGIWKRLQDLYKKHENLDEKIMSGYIIPCDECIHFGNCGHEKQCNEDVHTGRALKHFKEKK